MKMKLYETILLTLNYSEEKMIAGRTLFQKTLYFVNQKMKLGIEFDAHYYGPYSSAIADEIASLTASGMISECVETFPSFNFGSNFEPRKYLYSLSDLGRKVAQIVATQDTNEAMELKKILDEMKEAGAASDYKSLSVSAKMFHILKAKGRGRASEILDEAEVLGWSITKEEADASVEFLKKMGLVQVESPLKND